MSGGASWKKSETIGQGRRAFAWSIEPESARFSYCAMVAASSSVHPPASQSMRFTSAASAAMSNDHVEDLPPLRRS